MGPGIPDGKTFRELIKEPRFTIALLVFFLPFLIWAASSLTELRKKAAEGDVCVPVNKVITVTPPGGAGTCHDIQTAINAVPDGNGTAANQGFTISLSPGTYTIPETNQSFSLIVRNKDNVAISGYPGPARNVKLRFPNNRGGLQFLESSGVLEWVELSGSTANGILRVENSRRVSLSYLYVDDDGANSIQLNNTDEVGISTSDIQSYSVAVWASDVRNLLVGNNTIQNAKIGVAAYATSGRIFANLFTNLTERAVSVSDTPSIAIESNTMTSNFYSDQNRPAAIDIDGTNQMTVAINKNIVAFNTGAGVESRADNAEITFTRNDVFDNDQGNFRGIPSPVGSNGNISADPLFGSQSCLRSGSPATYGSAANQEYMGHRGPCANVSPTPTSTTTPTPTDSPTPTPTPRPDDLFFHPNSSSALSNTFLIASGNGTPSELSTLVPGQPYQLTFNPVIQNIVKTTTIDSRPVIVTLQVNGVPLDEVSMFYSLVSNHADGAAPGALTATFVAQQTNVFEAIIDKANTLSETNESNNKITKTTPGITPTLTPSISPTVTLTPTTTLTPTPTLSGQRLSSFSLFTSVSGVTRNRGSIPMEVTIGKMGSSAVLYSTSVSTAYQRDDIHQGTLIGTSDKPLPEALSGNTYWIMLKAPHSVRRAYTNLGITNNALLNLSGKSLEAGDLPLQDGYVNHKDINTMLGIIASPTQSRNDLDTADVNRDGRVNAIDFGLLLKGLAIGTDEVAQ